jgi:hypothetical protein
LISTALFNAIIVAKDIKPEFWGIQEIHFAGTLEEPGDFDDGYMLDFPPDIIEVYNFMWTGAYTLIGFEVRCGDLVVFSEGWGAGENGGYISYRIYQAYQWNYGPVDRLCIAYYDYYRGYPEPPVVDFSGYATLYGPDTGEESVNLNP